MAVSGKITRVNVEEYAKSNGLEPFQIDGIPEGFSWIKRNERQIGNVYDFGYLIALRPNQEWFNNEKAMCYKPIMLVTKNPTVDAINQEIYDQTQQLLKIYNNV